MAWDIVPAFNPYFYFRSGYRLARSGLRSLYRLRVGFAEEESMSGVNSEASVLFFFNHRSNIDYFIANYLTAKRSMLSFGAGEWSRIWPIQPLLRLAGGYFVRRQSGDPLYRLLLKRYVQLATAARVPHAIFLEGKLSTDGGVGEPRLGLLSYVTENFDPENSPDMVFIPIGLNYDRVAEDMNFLRFTSEDFRVKGPVYSVTKAAQFLFRVLLELITRRRSFGHACANFGKPISFRAFLAEHDVSWPDLDRCERFDWIERLGAVLTEEIRHLVPATPVPVLCGLWRDDMKIELSLEQLRERFNAEITALKQAGCHVVLVHNNVYLTLEHALKMVESRGMVRRTPGGGYKVNESLVPLLTYYINTIRPQLERSGATASDNPV